MREKSARARAAKAGVMGMDADSASRRIEMHEWPLWEVFIRSQHGLAHKHVGSLHAPDAEMAIKNARDVYTRRNEGVSIWAVRSSRHHGQLARRQGTDVRAGDQQGLSPSDVLSDARRSEAHLNMSDERTLFEYLLRLADSALILAQRLGEWVGHGPVLEEDIAHDQRRARSARPGAAVVRLRGRSRSALQRRAGRSEDELAFLRDAGEFRNLLLVEQPNGDYADNDGAPVLLRRLARAAAARSDAIRPTRASPRSPPRR